MNVFVLRRLVDDLDVFGNVGEDGKVFPVAFKRERVNGGSMRPFVHLFEIEDERFSAGYLGGGRRSNSESQSERKL